MNNLTTVNITYARIAILLLALNFLLTGYSVYSVVKIQLEQDTINIAVRSTKPLAARPCGCVGVCKCSKNP
jgi:hypothetical protein